MPSVLELAGAAGAGAVAGAVALRLLRGSARGGESGEYSIADQKARFEHAKRTQNRRVLDIDAFFDGSQLRGKRVLVVGASRGLGLEVARALVRCGAETIGTVRSPSDELEELGLAQVIEGVDTRSSESVRDMAAALNGSPVDVCIVVAGYFYGPRETLDSLNFDEELKMIDVCGVGPLRVAAALASGGLLRERGGRLAIITSQAGSVAWRQVQNPDGDNYGHHMSRAATNMMGRLLSFELRRKGVSVALLHPGFNRTDMTEKYADAWDEEGAVDPAVGAKRVLHEVTRMTLERTGQFINCEDGLLIPW